jgi:hypothetical protein
MSRSKTTDAADACANAEATPRRYRVVIEMVQIFTDEVQIEADSAGLALAAAQKRIDAGALGHLEFQDLASTEYRVASVQVLR